MDVSKAIREKEIRVWESLTLLNATNASMRPSSSHYNHRARAQALENPKLPPLLSAIALLATNKTSWDSETVAALELDIQRREMVVRIAQNSKPQEADLEALRGLLGLINDFKDTEEGKRY